MADDEKRIVTKKATAKPEAAQKIVSKKTVAKKAGPRKVVAKTADAAAPKPPSAAKKVAARGTKKTAVEKAAAPRTAAKPASAPASGRAPAATARPAAAAKPMPAAAPRSPQSSLPLEERSRPQPAASLVSAQERYRMIEEAAYYKAEKRNFDPSFNAQNWAEAEREIDAMLAARRR
jgi:hypothetical protein